MKLDDLARVQNFLKRLLFFIFILVTTGVEKYITARGRTPEYTMVTKSGVFIIILGISYI